MRHDIGLVLSLSNTGECFGRLLDQAISAIGLTWRPAVDHEGPRT